MPDDVQARFDVLQQKLVPLWRSIQSFNQDEQTIVIVPSMSLDFTATGAVLQAYEERFLFLLLLLRQPRARVVYVTSQDINPTIIDYYLDLLPGVLASHARRRLFPRADGLGCEPHAQDEREQAHEPAFVSRDHGDRQRHQ